LVRELQPQALIAICGPDVRWVGNEDGLARENETSTQPIGKEPWMEAMHPGKRFIWYPAECDVSIRPGWFYHAEEDNKVKSLAHLLDIYYKSVGRNSVLLLNVPPDRRGLVHENDVRRLAELGAEIERRFGRAVAETSGRGGVLELSLRRPTRIDHCILMEAIAAGERVKEYVLEAQIGEEWKPLHKGVVIGHKQIIRFEPVETSKVRLRAPRSRGEPAIRRLAAYYVGATGK
jgi:alpha-L-fucosidase